MHTLIALDAAGRPLTPSITWGDTRAADQAERLRAAGPALHRRTGTPLHPMSPLAKLMWFREQDPDTFAAARRWVGIKELVLAHLCGRVGRRPLGRLGHRPAGARRRSTGTRRRCALAGVEPGAAPALVPTTHVLPGLTDGRRPRARPPRRHAGGGRRVATARWPTSASGAVRPGRRRVLHRHERRAAGDGRGARRRPARAACSATRSRRTAGWSAGRSTTAASSCTGPARRSPPSSPRALGARAAGARRARARPARAACSCCPTCSASARRTGARSRAGPTSG